MNIEDKDILKTKEILLEAAKKEFAEKGYDGARMGSIAKRSGINQSLIHYHFQSKDHLYLTIINISIKTILKFWKTTCGNRI